MGALTSPTKSSASTKASPAERSLRPILKRKGVTGYSSLLGSARFTEQQIVHDQKPDMAASFLQYCAMCEKQIMTPINSILYCSEACRRKDSMKPLSAANITTSSISLSPPPSEPPSPRPLLSPRQPTGTSVSHGSPVLSSSIPIDLHDHTSDLDPTEWKPKLGDRTSSEAFRYLSRFHHASMASFDHSSTTTGSSVPTPSLGTTPNTTPSSFSSSAGLGSTPRYSSSHSGYEFYSRPLPARQNRWYGLSSNTPKGVDLVTPHIAPAMPTPVTMTEEFTAAVVGYREEEGLKWEKRKVMFANAGKGDDGLSVLFADRL